MPDWMRELYLRTIRDSENLEDIYAYFSGGWNTDRMPFGFLNKKVDDTPRQTVAMLFPIKEFLLLTINHPYADRFDFQQRVWPEMNWRILKCRFPSVQTATEMCEEDIDFTAVGEKL